MVRFPNPTIGVNLGKKTFPHCRAGSPFPAILGRLKDGGTQRSSLQIYGILANIQKET